MDKIIAFVRDILGFPSREREQVQRSDKSLPRGYPWYAAWIAEDKDNEADVYRVFRRLSARTLLYRQAELARLEALLVDQEDEDARIQKRPDHNGDVFKLTNNWPWDDNARAYDKKTFVPTEPGSEQDNPDLGAQKNPAGGVDQIPLVRLVSQESKQKSGVPEVKAVQEENIYHLCTRCIVQQPNKLDSRLKLIEDIDRKLSEYHALLLQRKELLTLENPGARVLNSLRAELNDSNHVSIRDYAKTYLDDERDLVALRKPPQADPLTRFVRRFGGKYFKKDTASVLHGDLNLSDDRANPIIRFSERRINFFTTICTISAATIILVGAILGLHFASTEAQRLGFIVMFALLFAPLVWATTTATRSEIFGSTAAFAAVLVVYVGSPLASGGNSGGSSK